MVVCAGFDLLNPHFDPFYFMEKYLGIGLWNEYGIYEGNVEYKDNGHKIRDIGWR